MLCENHLLLDQNGIWSQKERGKQVQLQKKKEKQEEDLKLSQGVREEAEDVHNNHDDGHQPGSRQGTPREEADERVRGPNVLGRKEAAIGVGGVGFGEGGGGGGGGGVGVGVGAAEKELMLPWHFVTGISFQFLLFISLIVFFQIMPFIFIHICLEVYNSTKSKSPLDPGFYTDLQGYLKNGNKSYFDALDAATKEDQEEYLTSDGDSNYLFGNDGNDLMASKESTSHDNKNTECDSDANNVDTTNNTTTGTTTDTTIATTTTTTAITSDDTNATELGEACQNNNLSRWSANATSSSSLMSGSRESSSRSCQKLDASKENNKKLVFKLCNSITNETLNPRVIIEELDSLQLRKRYFICQMAFMQTLTDISCLIKAMKLPSKEMKNEALRHALRYLNRNKSWLRGVYFTNLTRDGRPYRVVRIPHQEALCLNSYFRVCVCVDCCYFCTTRCFFF